MARPGPFEQMFNLAVGEELVVSPSAGEMPATALKRIKLRAAKYKPNGRSYRAKVSDGCVIVQRTPFGKNTKLADFFLMKAGERLVLKAIPNAADIKKSVDLQTYLNFTRVVRKKDRAASVEEERLLRGTSGTWMIGFDRQGRLVADCWADEHGGAIEEAAFDQAPLSYPWAGEWP